MLDVCNLLSICVWSSKEEVSGLTPHEFIGVWFILLLLSDGLGVEIYIVNCLVSHQTKVL